MRVSEAEQVVDEILNRVGKRVVLATQLGLGKPVQILNALYRRAKNDPRLHLTIITGLTLLRPKIKNDLGQRLLGPYLARVFGDYEDLQFELDRRACALPSNVRVIEFFFTAAAYLHNAKAQQNFICSNYTHVVRDGLQYGINVVAMVLAERATDRRRLSMSCNADLINDLLQKMKGIMVVGEINHNLPYMFGSEVEIEAAQVDAILENQHSHRHLFSLPKVMVTDQEFMIGLYVSSLIKDDGCLQIGIGSLNDAIVYSLIMRHTKNQQYTDVFE
ncbi:MAG TPA: hypothetical protein VEL47_05070, partial [Myxococcota bacterium]|nr:hypothetical protein [Myxococcota bacterium]